MFQNLLQIVLLRMVHVSKLTQDMMEVQRVLYKLQLSTTLKLPLLLHSQLEYLLGSPKKPAWLNDFVTMAVVKKHKYPISNHLTYEHITPQYMSFVHALTAEVDPTQFSAAVQDAKWCTAMNSEIRALEENGTWIVTKLPHNNCYWLQMDL